jgi:hypothetical protein
MSTRRTKAGLGLGVVFLMISGRWAVAAEGAAVSGVVAPVQPSPPPSAPPALLGLPPAYDAEDMTHVENVRTAAGFLSVPGSVALGAGAIWLFADLFENALRDAQNCFLQSPCPPPPPHISLERPLLLTGVGAALVLIPVAWYGAEKHAADARARARQISFAAAPSAAGATFALTGRF